MQWCLYIAVPCLSVIWVLFWDMHHHRNPNIDTISSNYNGADWGEMEGVLLSNDRRRSLFLGNWCGSPFSGGCINVVYFHSDHWTNLKHADTFDFVNQQCREFILLLQLEGGVLRAPGLFLWQGPSTPRIQIEINIIVCKRTWWSLRNKEDQCAGATWALYPKRSRSRWKISTRDSTWLRFSSA